MPSLRNKPTALIVVVAADYVALRTVIAKVLLRHGYTPWEAADASRARSLCDDAGENLELLIVDNRVLGSNGLKLIQTVRATHRSVPAILMSASDPEVSDARTLVLTKPFSLIDLIAAVSCLVIEQESSVDADLSAALEPPDVTLASMNSTTLRNGRISWTRHLPSFDVAGPDGVS
jgi:DNA-binding response OmpR family regulator